MTKFLMFLLALLFAVSSFAQSVGINSNGTAPNSSAMLDVSSTSKGFLPPRMSRAQRVTIASPVAGLIIWCNDCGTSGELQVYNGTSWTNMVGGPTVAIGDNFQGGIVFYILQPGDPGYNASIQHGLIAATTDQSTGAAWSTFGGSIGGTSTAIGSGQANTMALDATCPECAAKICDFLDLNGYSDWFLPSRDELLQMRLQQALIGGFTSNFYWSSSEYSEYAAWGVSLNEFVGGAGDGPKSEPYYVRAVRAF